MRRFATIFLAAMAFPAWGQGPIETRIGRAISLPFFRFTPRGDLIPEGSKEYSIGFSVANDLRGMPESGPYNLLEDYEVDALRLKYRTGTKRGEWSFELPILSRGGGFLDPLIEWWHEHVLGINNLRSTIALGHSEVIVPGSGRFGSATGFGDISATYSHTLSSRLFAAVAIKLPTGDANRLLGSGAFDAGLSLNYKAPINAKWDVYAQAGIVGQGKATALQSSRGLIDQESLSFVYKRNSRDLWTLQWQSERSALQTGIAGSDSTHRMLSAGYTRKLSSNQWIQAYFSEDGDILNYRVPELVNIAPDFSIGVTWTVRF